MGPRLGSRGKSSLYRAIVLISIASMGPRLGSRGKRSGRQGRNNGNRASMGPRLGSRGKPAIKSAARNDRMMLQWGRDLEVAERALRGSSSC